jgi:hypothetical protein
MSKTEQKASTMGIEIAIKLISPEGSAMRVISSPNDHDRLQLYFNGCWVTVDAESLLRAISMAHRAAVEMREQRMTQP